MATSANLAPEVPRRTGIGLRTATPALLFALAALGWWWSARMAGQMTSAPKSGMASMDMGPGEMATMGAMSGGHVVTIGAFLVAWVAMMGAMMFPAIAPVVTLYGRAAAAGRVAPLPFFVAGYLAVWASIGVPAYWAWRALMEPVASAEPWAARLAGVVLIGAAAWQLTPLKTMCLRHCRSPISFFLRFGAKVTRPVGALRMGATHGLFCLGCCWALMAVLVALGTMNLAWMAALALLILLEKNAPFGESVAQVAAVLFAVAGIALLVDPRTLTTLTLT